MILNDNNKTMQSNKNPYFLEFSLDIHIQCPINPIQETESGVGNWLARWSINYTAKLDC